MAIHRSHRDATVHTQHMTNSTFEQQCQLMKYCLNHGMIPSSKVPASLKGSIDSFFNYDGIVNRTVDVVTNDRYSTVKELSAFRPKFTHSIYDEERRASLASKNAGLIADVFLLLAKEFDGCNRPYVYLMTYTQEKADKGALNDAMQLVSTGFTKLRDWLKKSRQYDTALYDFPTANGERARFMGDEQGLEVTNGRDAHKKMQNCDPHAMWHAHGHQLTAFTQPLDLTTPVILTRSEVPNMKEFRVITDAATAFFFKRWCKMRPDKTFALQAFKIEPVGDQDATGQAAIDSIRAGLVEVSKYAQKPDKFGNFADLVRKSLTSNYAQRQLQFRAELFAEAYNALHGRTLHRSHGLMNVAHSFVQAVSKVKLLSSCISATTSNYAQTVVPDLFTKHGLIDFDDDSDDSIQLEDLNDDAILYFNNAYLAESGLDPAILQGLKFPLAKYDYQCLDGSKVNRSQMFQFVLNDMTYQPKGKQGLLSRLDKYVDVLTTAIDADQRGLDVARFDDDRDSIYYYQSRVELNQSKLSDVNRVKIAVVNGLDDNGDLTRYVDFDTRIKSMKLFDSMQRLADNFKFDWNDYAKGQHLDSFKPAIKIIADCFGSMLDESLIDSDLNYIDGALIDSLNCYVRLTTQERSKLVWEWARVDRRTLSYNSIAFIDSLPVRTWFEVCVVFNHRYSDCVVSDRSHLQNLINKYWA